MITSSTGGPAPAPRPQTARKVPWGTLIALFFKRNWRGLGIFVILFIIFLIIALFIFRPWEGRGNNPRFDSFAATVAPYQGSTPPSGLVLGDGSALGCAPGYNKLWLKSKNSGQPASITLEGGDIVSAEWTTKTVILTIANPDGLKSKYPAGYYNGEGSSQGFIVPAIPDGAKSVVLTGVFDKSGAFVGTASARGAVLCTDGKAK